MANVFIYAGLIILCIASLIALFASIKGYALSKSMDKAIVKSKIRNITKAMVYTYILGGIILAIGIIIGLY